MTITVIVASFAATDMLGHSTIPAPSPQPRPLETPSNGYATAET